MTEFLRHIENKNVEVIVKHNIFSDENKIIGRVSGIIDNNEKIGVSIGRNSFWCRKNSDKFSVVVDKDVVLIKDNLMEMYIRILK